MAQMKVDITVKITGTFRIIKVTRRSVLIEGPDGTRNWYKADQKMHVTLSTKVDR